MIPIQFIHSTFSQSFYNQYIKYALHIPPVESCCVPFESTALNQDHDKLLHRATWIVYISRYDLDGLPAFMDQLIHLAEVKEVQKLMVILPMSWGISPVHKMIRAAAYRVCACHVPATVIQYPPFYHEIFMNAQLLWEGGYLMLPIGTANLPWVNVEELLKRISIELAQPAPHAQVNYLTHTIIAGGRYLAAFLSKLSKQVGYEAYTEKLFYELDLNEDESIGKEELLTHWEPLNWTDEEVTVWLNKSLPTSNQKLSFDEVFTPVSSLMREHIDFAPPSFTYIHVSIGIALQEEDHKLLLNPEALNRAIAYWKGVEEHFAHTGSSLSVSESELEAYFSSYFHLPSDVYLIPGEGIVKRLPSPTQQGLISQQLITRNGRVLHRTLPSNDQVMTYELSDTTSSTYITYPFKETQTREIGIHEHQLTSVQGEIHWMGWREALDMLIYGNHFPEWKQKLFRTTGELALTEEHIEGQPNDILCNCMKLTRTQCWEWMNRGCKTVKDIARETNATTICGGCYPLIEEVVENKQLVFAEISDKYYLGGEITQLRLRPVNEPVVQAEPGQHILLQGKMDNEWVTRAYTLTATTEEYYEVAIKREDNGKFSRWLSDQRNEEILLRISAPRGNFTLSTQGGAVYFFAGGIGVTPALAMIRTLPYRKEKRPFHLDWSVGGREKLVFKEEIDYWERRVDRFSRIFRITSESGRLSQTIIQDNYPYQEGSVAYVCGPEGYNEMMFEALTSSGWPESFIKLEVFSSTGATVSTSPIPKPTPTPMPEASKPVAALPQGCPVNHKDYFLAAPEKVDIYTEAHAFLKQCYYEMGIPEQYESRWKEVREALRDTGTYVQTLEEMTFGARVAWRNSARCIGRFFWDKLQVRDMRHLTTAGEMFEAMIEHMSLGTNDGEIVPMISIFAPQEGLRIWNHQLIQYAAYQQPDGSIIGDPKNLELTQKILELGWPGGEGTHFDILPIVIQIPDQDPQWFEIPKDRVLEVPIIHPRYEWFAELGLKWYALPAVSNMALDMGGIQYTLVPFNGFYMGTEIGARNFADTYRYDMLKIIADRLHLDTSRSYTLWKDVALVELNIAVLYSYQQQGVRMMDHHTLSEYFLRFDQQESACQRPVYADWTWIVPPISGSSVKVFHIDKWENKLIKPNYYYMEDAWKLEGTEEIISQEQHPVHVGNYSG